MKNLLHSRSWFLKPDRGGKGTNLMAEIRKTPPFSGVPGHVKFKAADFQEGCQGDRPIHSLARHSRACAVVKDHLQKGEAFTLEDLKTPAFSEVESIGGPTMIVHLKNSSRPTALQVALKERTMKDLLSILPEREARRVGFSDVLHGAEGISRGRRDAFFGGADPEKALAVAEYAEENGLFKTADDVKGWWGEASRTAETKKKYAGLLARVKRAGKAGPSLSRFRGEATR